MYYVDNDVPLRFEIFRGHEIVHGISTRRGAINLRLDDGRSEDEVEANYEKFAQGLEVPREKIVVALQEHTDEVLRVGEADAGRRVENVDGFVTDTVGLPIMVRFADCQGALFYDPVKRVVAAVHCGWRGNAQNILGKTARKMVAEFGCVASDILVGIGPSLEPAAAEFSDPSSELPPEMQKYVDEGRRVNLWKCSEEQLRAEGIEQIEIARMGTFGNPEEFYSHRYSAGNMGHMGGLIMLT